MKKIILFSFLLSLIFSSNIALAKIEGGLSTDKIAMGPHVEPDSDFFRTKLTYETSPGSTIEDALDIANLTDQPIEVILDSVDSENPDPRKFSLKASDHPKETIGKWFSIKEGKMIKLDPKEERVIPFTLTVPKDQAAGSYWGGVTLEGFNIFTTKTIKTNQNTNNVVHVQLRLGLRTLVKVTPGAITKRLADGAYPRVKPDTITFLSLIREFALWKKIALIAAAIYIMAFLLWHGGEKLKTKRKIHPKFHRFFLPFHTLVIIGLFVILSQSLNVFAINASLGIGLPPGQSFSFSGNPGDRISGKLTVDNGGTELGYGYVYAVDAEMSDQGYVSATADDRERQEIGKWLEVAETYVAVPGGKQKLIDFVINIPKEATPGDYSGALIVKGAPPPSKIPRSQSKKEVAQESAGESAGEISENTNVIAIETRVAKLVHLAINGERILKSEIGDSKVEESSDGKFVYIAFVTNTGNVKFTPVGTFELKNSSGEVVGKATVSAGNPVLPGKTAAVRFELPWNKKDLPFDTYTVRAKIGDTVKEVNKTANFVHKAPPPPTQAITQPGTPDGTNSGTTTTQVIVKEITKEFNIASILPWGIGLVILVILINIGVMKFFLRKKKEQTPQ